MLSKKKIIQNAVKIGGSTLLSRFFGIMREVLMIRYLGASIFSDAFITAFKIPNSLRKIFAEGALSAAFVPTIVKTIRQKDKKTASHLITLGFLIFESILLLICIVVMLKAKLVIQIFAPGFSETQVLTAVPYLKILMPIILFFSSSSLVASALQSVGQFFVPAFSNVLFNIVFIIGIVTCLKFNLDITALCWFIMLGGFLHFLWNLAAYFWLQFEFKKPHETHKNEFKKIVIKFLWGLPSASLAELNLIIDTSFASYLAVGSTTLIYYANRFMLIPLSIFGTALATVLLPHFSHVGSYAPKRFNFYLLESAKLIFWIMIPASLLMGFFSEKIFITMFLSSKFDILKVREAAQILSAFLIGLSFAALNKILLTIFYSMHDTKTPAIIAIAATTVNLVTNWFMIDLLQATGLALATTASCIVQTILYLTLLKNKFNFKIYLTQFWFFLFRYCLQLFLLAGPFVLIYQRITGYIETLSPEMAHLLLNKVYFWFWVAPLCGVFALVTFYSRRIFKIKLYFID